jgi:hypothetical protein
MSPGSGSATVISPLRISSFRAPAPQSTAPQAERAFSLRLDHDAQGFAERARARR